MMKGGKEDDKIACPLFPRLHVSDADKGGPRAPPRNKMALYEQLSIPSQRFKQAAASSSSLPLPSYNAGTLIPSASSSQVGSHDWSVFSPFPRPQTPAQSAEMVQSRPFDGNNLKSTRTETARSVGRANHKSSNSAGSVAECSSFRPRDYSTVKNFREEEDFRVPTFAYSEIAHSNKDTCVMETERLTPFHSNSPQRSCSATLISSMRFPSSYGKPLEQTSIDKKSGKLEKNHTEQNSKETAVIKETKEKCVSHLETGDKFAEPSKACSDQEHTGTGNVIESTHQRSTAVCQEYCGNGAIDGLGCLNDINDVENEDALRLRIESCSKASFANSQRSKNMAGDCNHSSDDKVSVSVELRDGDRDVDVSETSMVDSISGLEISPDVVVGIIGPKQFWKAKRAIVNQQRVFAVQVFELHRLIKVQKLIAASPHLLEENLYVSGSPQKVPNNILPPESNAKPQLQIAKQDDSHKLNQNTECRTENTQLPPLSPRDDGLNKGLHQVPKYGPYSRVPPLPVPVSSENKPAAWCYPPANHWLVPVMLPSEGLVYKPYSGLCPPAAGFMPPVYGGYGPLSLPPVTGDFMKAAYGVPAAHQRQNMAILSGASAIPPNYFPTLYGLPAVNPNISASSVEQVRPMTGPRPKAQIEQRSQSSCNMTIARSEAFSGCPWKVPTSQDSELQGSTASSPERRVQEGREALLLFPRASAMEGPARPSQSHGRNGQTRVIRVVPHNARSATESAARIFRSIQEERQQ